MEFSTSLGVTLIALLLAFWSITWARRAASAARRTAIAAEKSALAAERSAMAARRAAEASEASAVKAVEATRGDAMQAGDPGAQSHAKEDRVDAAVKELIEIWPKDASAWPLIDRHPELGEDEVEAIINKAFHLMGRSETEAKHHSVAVLNMRRDHPAA